MEKEVEMLRPIFANGPIITKTEGVKTVHLGRGLFETDLVNLLGFDKRGLKRLEHAGVLLRVTTRFKGGWRNTYVLIDSQDRGTSE